MSRHTEAEIIEYLYKKVHQVSRYYDAALSEGKSAELLLTQVKEIDEVEDILKALHKRNQERQAQADMV